MNYHNPFEYREANILSKDELLDYYIEDENYSRFLKSRRNIYLKGERGCGKTMTLLYNSSDIQKLKSEKRKEDFDLDIVCIYVSCKTALHYKTEWQLLNSLHASSLSEHYFVLSIMSETLTVIKKLNLDISEEEIDNFVSDITFLLDIEFPPRYGIFEGFKMVLDKISNKTQKSLNRLGQNNYEDDLFTFSSGVLPLLSSLKKFDVLRDSHFAFLLDDVQDLNIYQQKVMNSWISYRDNTSFSFKLASTKIGSPIYITSSGGTILEGHDFTTIDMERPYQNKYTEFARLANKIVVKRLKTTGIDKTPEEYFPINTSMQKDLEEAKEAVRKEAVKIYGAKEKKKISDYVFKYTRAHYFRSRAPQSNRPPYSGFDLLVHMSTGVIRNLLEPCYWMYDAVYSKLDKDDKGTFVVDCISPDVQTHIILERSKKLWEDIRGGLDKIVEGCTNKQAGQIYNMFNQLAVFFYERLRKYQSEPRAVTFTISGFDQKKHSELKKLLEFSRKAQILYVYTSSSKDMGQREVYYVPNRILLPDRGLDPYGQNARASIPANILWQAASQNKKIPLKKGEEGTLFDGNN